MSYPRVPVIKTPDWERVAAGAINRTLKKTQVIGEQQSAIADAATVAAAPTQAEHNALVAQVNAILAALRTHGLIAS